MHTSASGEPDENLVSVFPSLSFKERLIGFAICWIMGMLISLSSFGSFADLLLGFPFRFAVLYSLGNLTALGSTVFLVGPSQQLRNMMHHSRRVSAAIYITCLVLTLTTAFSAPELSWLIITLVIVQWVALIWYSLSYIPFSRSIATGIARRLLVWIVFAYCW